MSLWRETTETRRAQSRLNPAEGPFGELHQQRHQDARAMAEEILSIGAAGDVATFLLSEVERLGEPVGWE
ncbi:hypothetical protein [Neorhizobium alkalisoli]|jgi:hypothetical protein|uniref:hypothetical protein n=1 Tax=Neorhizobium alkalisoli TaxID=528178 RepID=UPI000CF99875|nr:hypothetical protein [Neorhizobium alkalisoli]